MTNRIGKIVIVGGGTAGWLTATYLNRALNGDTPRCKITLVESDDIDTIGVGEATIPTLRHTLRFLGFDEADWMVHCKATFNMGLKLVNWRTGADSFWFPFQPETPGLGEQQTKAIAHWFKQKRAGKITAPFDSLVSSTPHLCEAKKSVRDESYPRYEGAVNYGYHLDAGLFATYLKEKSKAAGVHHIVDTVVDVTLTETGFIESVVTENHGAVSGDFFIDCSGFRGILLNGALHEPFTRFEETLFCDRAIAINVPTDDKTQGINPHTTATALDAGWAWHTPLYGRSGNGYVYASEFISPEAAEAEFRTYLGPAAGQSEARHLHMRVGHHQRVWVNNCVSIGLAGGFLEPLKSTGILLIEVGLKHLIENFPDKRFLPSFQEKYNRLIANYYEEFRDFIILHYYLSERTDTAFWQAIQHEPVLSDTLQARLEQYRTMLPSPDDDILHFGFFGHIFTYGYAFLLAGMGYLPDQSPPILAFSDDQVSQRLFDTTRQETSRLLAALPDHYQYLT
ncbi:MAG: tryptophan halogenase family protein, partial [Chloroflexota bacterium]